MLKKKEFNQKKKKMKKEVFPAKANPKENLPELATIVSEHGDWRSTAMVWWFGAAAMVWSSSDGVVVWSGGNGGFSLFLSFRSSLSLTPILSLKLDVGFGLL